MRRKRRRKMANGKNHVQWGWSVSLMSTENESSISNKKKASSEHNLSYIL